MTVMGEREKEGEARDCRGTDRERQRERERGTPTKGEGSDGARPGHGQNQVLRKPCQILPGKCRRRLGCGALSLVPAAKCALICFDVESDQAPASALPADPAATDTPSFQHSATSSTEWFIASFATSSQSRAIVNLILVLLYVAFRRG